MLHCVEINYITPEWKSGKTLELIQDRTITDEQLQNILGTDLDKELDEIINVIDQQNTVDKRLLDDAKQIVSEASLNSELDCKNKLARVLKRLMTAVEKTITVRQEVEKITLKQEVEKMIKLRQEVEKKIKLRQVVEKKIKLRQEVEKKMTVREEVEKKITVREEVEKKITVREEVEKPPLSETVRQKVEKKITPRQVEKKYTPRLTQMVSWALMALSEKGRLIQVSTGEGKTCIVAMFAAYRALQGHKVDIMSSSPVLAERDFKEWQKFYQELKITVSCNVNKMNSDCYKSQVVYGTAEDFAADWLRQTFGREDIRGDRPFQCAIVDEVDSLMLDKGCHTVYLGNEMPALQHLNPLLAHIWHTVNQYIHNERGLSTFTNKEIAVKAIKEKIQSDLHFTPCDVTDKTYCFVPGFFKEFVELKLEDWIAKAFDALAMTSDHEYAIERHGVVPVDFSSTGVLENSMEWTDGLHQFLQMKHQNKLSDMSSVTNFMSNVGLLNMYKDQIYGVTGTLGQKVETETLQKIYNGITACYIPTFKRRKLFEVEGVIVDSEDEWLQKICEVIRAQTRPTVYRSERAVLVICETISRAKAVHEALGNSVQNKTLYISNNMDNGAVTDTVVTPRRVIIATNLAGRGTDLKVSASVKSAGGLFVLQTFLPSNARVEAQAFGRTGRQGSPGSAQLIICTQHLPNTLQLVLNCAHHKGQKDDGLSQILSEVLTSTSDTGIKLAKRVRDQSVAEELNNYLESVIPKMKKKQELFNQYLVFINDFYQSNNNRPAECDVAALHEFWGLWLLMNDNDKDPSDVQKRKLASDLETARESLRKRESPLSNLHHYTLFGNKLLEQGHIEASILMYSRAIEQDHCWAAIAFYNRAFARLTQQDNNQDPDCIEQALKDLQQALKSVELYCLQQELILRYSKVHLGVLPMAALTRFDHHQNTRCKVFLLLKNNIEQAIGKLTRARNLGSHVKVEKRLVFFMAPIQDYLPSLVLSTGSVRLLQSRDQLGLQQLVTHSAFDIFHELESLKSLGLTDVFVLDNRFSLGGFFSKIGRTITQ